MKENPLAHWKEYVRFSSSYQLKMQDSASQPVSILTVVSLKVVFSMWRLLNSDICWGLVFKKLGKQESIQIWLTKPFEITHYRAQFWIRREMDDISL